MSPFYQSCDVAGCSSHHALHAMAMLDQAAAHQSVSPSSNCWQCLLFCSSAAHAHETAHWAQLPFCRDRQALLCLNMHSHVVHFKVSTLVEACLWQNISLHKSAHVITWAAWCRCKSVGCSSIILGVHRILRKLVSECMPRVMPKRGQLMPTKVMLGRNVTEVPHPTTCM